MILRPFTFGDCPVILKYQYPDSSAEEIKEMILQWNTRQYDGRYFEMLAIENDGDIVGYVSVFALSDNAVSEGIEIYAPYRRKGFASTAIAMLFRYVKALGYATVTGQVRQDNAASIALHKKCGFQITNSFCNRRGHLVFTFAIEL